MEEMARGPFLDILATFSHVLTNSVFLHAWILSKIELVRRSKQWHVEAVKIFKEVSNLKMNG